MQKAILKLDDWGLYAEISQHRTYDIELGTILGQIEQLQLDAERSISRAKPARGGSRLLMPTRGLIASAAVLVQHANIARRWHGPRNLSTIRSMREIKRKYDCGQSF
jgi:hypothetical protein